jgi:hypothetical protein
MKEDTIKQFIKIKVGFLLVTEQGKYYECTLYPHERNYVINYSLTNIRWEFKEFINGGYKYIHTYRFKRKRSITPYLQYII